jgi:quercetin dioxygenase-like cupin family protein
MRSAAVAAFVALVSVWPIGVAFSQDLPPGPTTMEPLRRMNVDAGPERYEEAQILNLDFAPGRWTPRHSHGGLTLVRVLEGEMTVRHDDGDQVYGPGEGWVEQPGDIHAAGNLGTEMAKVQVTFLLAKGAPLTTAQGVPSDSPPPGPSTAFTSKRVELAAPLQAFDESATTVLGFAANAWTPMHSHPGLTLVGVTEGAMTVRSGGTETTYEQGDLWIEKPGDIHAAGNKRSSDANVTVTFLGRRGAPVTVAAAQAQAPAQLPQALPRTGDVANIAVPISIAAGALVGAGMIVRRARRP